MARMRRATSARSDWGTPSGARRAAARSAERCSLSWRVGSHLPAGGGEGGGDEQVFAFGFLGEFAAEEVGAGDGVPVVLVVLRRDEGDIPAFEDAAGEHAEVGEGKRHRADALGHVAELVGELDADFDELSAGGSVVGGRAGERVYAQLDGAEHIHAGADEHGGPGRAEVAAGEGYGGEGEEEDGRNASCHSHGKCKRQRERRQQHGATP